MFWISKYCEQDDTCNSANISITFNLYGMEEKCIRSSPPSLGWHVRLHQSLRLDDVPQSSIIVCGYSTHVAVPQPNVVVGFALVSVSFALQQNVMSCVNHRYYLRCFYYQTILRLPCWANLYLLYHILCKLSINRCLKSGKYYMF